MYCTLIGGLFLFSGTIGDKFMRVRVCKVSLPFAL